MHDALFVGDVIESFSARRSIFTGENISLCYFIEVVGETFCLAHFSVTIPMFHLWEVWSEVMVIAD